MGRSRRSFHNCDRKSLDCLAASTEYLTIVTIKAIKIFAVGYAAS